MKYLFKEITIKELVNLIDSKSLDLNPSYQRDFIWSTNDQKDLVDSVIEGMPLPNLFLYENGDGSFEMVDGQQRTKTLYRFVNGLITSSKKTGNKNIKDFDIDSILSYRLPFVILSGLKDKSKLNDFYVRINKKGKHLNVAELYKSEFSGTRFLELANECLLYQNFVELDLFTLTVSKRMNDRSYVEELLGFLKLGIRDKKKHIQKIFEEDINEEEYSELKENFNSIIDVISQFNDFKPLKKTRYRQKNDFYTLFCFVYENLGLSLTTFIHQYKILLVLDSNDNKGRQLIRPTNEECKPLRRYAENCVTQSNSKNARESRLQFFRNVLLNTNDDLNDDLNSTLNYLCEIYGEDKIGIINIEQYYLLDPTPLL